MMNPKKRRLLLIGIASLALVVSFIASQLPSWGAGALLHPWRRRVHQPPPANCEDAVFAGSGVTLKGWRGSAPSHEKRGTIICLHGVADNRASSAGVIERFTGKGFDVIAYDSRAHGESGGEFCTYGYFEKEDLRRVLDTIETGPIVLIGSSLGAAVALQAAADDPRVAAVVAAEVFCDLRTIARERVPSFLGEGMIRKALSLAGKRGAFDVDSVSPLIAARRVNAPVLLIHGAEDIDTRPEHSQRVFAALPGPKRLILVENARHNESLSQASVWVAIENWLAGVLQQAATQDR
jgi:pimeloyl-ACP methyl ester carboxylesterase